MRKLIVLSFLFGLKLFSQATDFKHISFEKADNVAKQFNGASLQNLPILVHQLTSNLDTDVEKFRAIYTWICLNIKNDHGNHVLNLRKRKKFQNDTVALQNWNNQFREKVLRNLKKHKKTICTGYTYLLQELSLLAGLNCKMVHGYGRTVLSNIDELSIPNHSWNVIELNNKWYLTDPTWSSGFFHIDEGYFVANFNDGYFLTDPELFVKSHYPLESLWKLTRNSFTIEDFLNGPLVYGNAFKYGVKPIGLSKMKLEVLQNDRLSFRFEVPEDFDINALELLVGSNSNNSPIEVFQLNSGNRIVEFENTFKRRGFYDVHLKLGEDLLVTYTVKVLKNKS
ncbi:hypothetical protein E1J38_007760 [Seonamhaeicola sediminis]|uniref:Transglutaminase-like domain-containing protein n=1 Tax=Seonamhaeicola sediminis TaxID=2528206 RepID=A0A562YEN0_9FLAO|nr:transglutaminase domain-containing protein [Seonamhaeicola sediminis]TWO32754.1 hypothetical protein E1J38_007760 [Seonamhaeicola sediminis]